MAASDIKREKSKWRRDVENGTIGGGGGGGSLNSPVEITGSALGASNVCTIDFNTSAGAGNSQLTLGQTINGNNLTEFINHQSNGQINIGTDDLSATGAINVVRGNTTVTSWSDSRMIVFDDIDIQFQEKADHTTAPVATRGLLWCRNDAPNSLMFTDDDGNDFVIGGVSAPLTATTTELEDITDAINTGARKVEGLMVFNSTTNIPVWAVGSADGSVWVDATGATAHTPV